MGIPGSSTRSTGAFRPVARGGDVWNRRSGTIARAQQGPRRAAGWVMSLRPERVDADHIRIPVRIDGLPVEHMVVIDREDPRFGAAEAQIARTERRRERRR